MNPSTGHLPHLPWPPSAPRPPPFHPFFQPSLPPFQNTEHRTHMRIGIQTNTRKKLHWIKKTQKPVIVISFLSSSSSLFPLPFFCPHSKHLTADAICNFYSFCIFFSSPIFLFTLFSHLLTLSPLNNNPHHTTKTPSTFDITCYAQRFNASIVVTRQTHWSNARLSSHPPIYEEFLGVVPCPSRTVPALGHVSPAGFTYREPASFLFPICHTPTKRRPEKRRRIIESNHPPARQHGSVRRTVSAHFGKSVAAHCDKHARPHSFVSPWRVQQRAILSLIVSLLRKRQAELLLGFVNKTLPLLLSSFVAFLAGEQEHFLPFSSHPFRFGYPAGHFFSGEHSDYYLPNSEYYLFSSRTRRSSCRFPLLVSPSNEADPSTLHSHISTRIITLQSQLHVFRSSAAFLSIGSLDRFIHEVPRRGDEKVQVKTALGLSNPVAFTRTRAGTTQAGISLF
ncbi:hypothetical protein ACRALDRAFT_210998 [Sodiomyces alcalophilus JCM 7366]|uniref:uncharacterized protein n=1 Tax=Sodiomyces alcalophilus JCM 7366 TaxID=591952 RepID=UPI0039B59635